MLPHQALGTALLRTGKEQPEQHRSFLSVSPITQGWYQTNCWALPASLDAKGGSLIKVTAGQGEMVKPSTSIMSALLSLL